MKKLLLILLCLPFIGFGQQQTYVPDDNFEAYLEANGMGNGIPNDDYVTTANINAVINLNVTNQNIADLTGIENFTTLNTLNCGNNQLTNLDVSNNNELATLHCEFNQLTNLNVSNNNELAVLHCEFNQIECLYISNKTSLHDIWCDNNALEKLHISNICWGCGDWSFQAYENNLACVELDNFGYMSAFDSFTTASTNCNYINPCGSVSAIQEYTTNKELLKVTDILGRETKQTNQPLFYIYDDGTVEKRTVIE